MTPTRLPRRPRFPTPRLALLAGVAALALAGCGTPHAPVNQQPSPTAYPYPNPNQPAPRDYRRRDSETLYEVPVSSVRAVVGPQGGQRCWMEREQAEPRRNVPGAIVGGVIGGILGHQIGNGSGRDIATVGGVVAGAAVGSNVGRNNQTQDVQRCTTDTSSAPEYWDVSYNFRGVVHHVQMSAPPGRTILVNGNGEPRI